MTIKELIELIKIGEIAQWIERELPAIEFDLIDLYFIDSLNIDSKIEFFNAEKISNKISMEIAGIKYINLFPLNMFQEMVEEYLKKEISTEEIARKILQYRIKDA